MTDKPDLTAVFSHYGVDITGLHGNRLVKCPAHDENRASCSVNLDKQVAQCFACDFRGDAITLIMLKEGLDFVSALRWAADHLDFTPSDRPRGRVGLDGRVRPSRGYRPKVRRKGLHG